MTSPSGPVSNSPSPVLPVQLSGQQSAPVNQSHISSLAGVMPSSSLEMLLLERAKILQQQNPVAKAFAELQGKKFWISIRNEAIFVIPLFYRTDVSIFYRSMYTYK
jgi:hypothetical protein